eukprot:TRINITY_DN3284_c0_g1_i1.p1 TRINITY_DN3284_c0_g1~~TRINITY_DN3284_c0_g1_i1.p1  ORF type:complete len:365 (+),score=104.34 TRINITY_DN3284_c0_g1_i1:41-1096(+)
MTQAAGEETRGIRLQQGVTVLVCSAPEIRQAWKDFKRDDYEPEMDKVAGKKGCILHQHPSGAFTVVFEGKKSGLKAKETMRLKFPPKALSSVDRVPVKKRKPRLPKHVKTKKAPPTPTPVIVEPEVVNEPPPAYSPDQRRIDECLTPSPKLEDKSAKQLSVEDARLQAIIEETEEHEQLELVAPVVPPEMIEEVAAARAAEVVDEVEEEDVDSEEERFLKEIEAEEEAAFLAGVDDDSDDSDDSDSTDEAPSPPREESEPPVEASTPPPPPAVDNTPRVQVVYEPHDSVMEAAHRFGSCTLKDKSRVDPNHLRNPNKANGGTAPSDAYSPRSQVVGQASQGVGDLRARFDQ